jgi:hypothetical protein
MPTPTRALTNDYRDCKLIRLDPNDPASPFVVAQVGYAPGDPSARMRLFYLQRDGQWIDEIARSTRPDSEAGEIVFETSAQAVQMLRTLLGTPLVREVKVTDADIQTYLTRVKSAVSPEAAVLEFLARYRAARGGA